ncbi:MAG TPA: peptidyl-prolyl cis-trans isomerase [Isosphaeraceae bacterium]
MDRRLIVCLLGLCLAGCALSRSGMPTGKKAQQPKPVEMGEVDSLPPVGESLARTYAERDAATRRAGQAPETVPDDDPAPAPAPPANLPPGRPAPFAGRASASPRIQAEAPSRTPAPRPAPFADQVPAGPRPQSPSAGPAPAPVAPPSSPAPADPAPTSAPAPAPLTPTSAISAPAPAPGPEPMPGAPPSPFADSPPKKDPEAPTDPQVRLTSGGPPSTPPAANKTATKTEAAPSAANKTAATVGTEIITLRQVYAALIEKKERYAEIWKKGSPADKEKIFQITLNGLIDRALLVQAAKKKIKDMKAFNNDIDRVWTDTELPPLLREYGVSNIHELKRKLATMGRSLDQMRDDFRQSTLAREFMGVSIKDKLHVSLPEMTKYYDENRERFRRPAEVVWREVEVDIRKCASRAEARARADAILERVRKGDDFARLAKAASHGATAKDGGRWKTAPGGSANPDINAALASLAAGQTSGVIEAPGSFHVVHVDSKREAGVAPFHEVQDQIKEELTIQKGNAAADALLTSLRSKTVVTTIFDTPDLDPSAARTGAKSAAR